MRLRTLLILTILLAAAQSLFAQGGHYSNIILGQTGTPTQGSVRVCQAGATGTPCTPPVSIYSDLALATPKLNPFTSDTLGNFDFYALPGRYVVQISGTGITTYTMVDVILPPDVSGAPGVTITGPLTASAGITTTTVTATTVNTSI